MYCFWLGGLLEKKILPQDWDLGLKTGIFGPGGWGEGVQRTRKRRRRWKLTLWLVSWWANQGRGEIHIRLNKTIHCHVAYLLLHMNQYLDFLMKAHFSYKLGLKTHYWQFHNLKIFAKYKKKINMTVKFLLITFKQSCVIMFLNYFSFFLSFWKKSLYVLFLAGWAVGEKNFTSYSLWCLWRGIFKGSFMQNFN